MSTTTPAHATARALGRAAVGATASAGSITTAARRRARYRDPSRPVAYRGYTGFIVRIDHTLTPPRITRAVVLDLDTSWPLRATLTYA